MQQQDDSAADEQPANMMNEIKTSASATPSTSVKRRQSEETYNNTTNEHSPSKKKRESAIRSGNNLKMLIQNKLLHYNPKQKVCPKKILSLRKKEDQTETLKTLITTGKFQKLEKLCTETVAAESRGSTTNDDTTATDDSNSNNEPDTIPPPERNILNPAPINETNATNTNKNSGKSKIPLPETVDSVPTQISHTNNLDQQEESNTNFKGIQSSLNVEISALQNRIQHLAPENGTEYQNIADIKHIEDIYNSILEVKSEMNYVYTEKSKQLKKAFESINLFVPELKKGLSLPMIEQPKENSRPYSDKLKTVSSRQEQPSQKKGTSSHLRTPSPQQSESYSDSEYFSQSPKPSTASKSRCCCSYVAEWTLNHQGPGSGLTELMPNTGIYVSEDDFFRCKQLGKNMIKFARLLLPLIFTKEALSRCSYTGKRSKSKDTRPGLDEHARNVLIDYLKKHAKESGWTIVSRKVLIQILRNKLRSKNKNLRNKINNVR